jgi:integrase
MASLQKKGESWYCQFLYHGKRHTFAVGKVSESEAHAKANQVDYLLMRLRQHFLTLPSGMDLVTFLQFDGKPPKEDTPDNGKAVTLGALRDQYMRVHEGSLEDTTIGGMRLHFRHLVATLGERFPMQELSLASLQDHAARRETMKGIGGKLRPATIRKELITLRTAWNWAVGFGLLEGRFPALKKVRLQKPEEKPPFQTWTEIERRTTAGGLSTAEERELWDALYLTLPDIEALLGYAKENATQPWLYPLLSLAAHTGARRSEMLRVLIPDVDFRNSTILIREKKRSHEKRTTRRVPMTSFLANVFEQWLSAHPGGQHLFSQSTSVSRSKTKRIGPTPVTTDEAHDHFKRTLAASKWAVLRGYHIFRHSFISLCATRGVDQRFIDEWVGHQTEEQRKRYRHLLPSTQQEVIRSVFGER